MDVDFVVLTRGPAALFAGFVDGLVGGGGSSRLPVLITAFPSLARLVLFGTNMRAGTVGTSGGALQSGRRVGIRWVVATPVALVALSGQGWGATVAACSGSELLAPLTQIARTAFVRGDQDKRSNEPVHALRYALIVVATGRGVGLYDGFLGPGTGGLLFFLLTHS